MNKKIVPSTSDPVSSKDIFSRSRLNMGATQEKSFLASNIFACDKPKSNWETSLSRVCTQRFLSPGSNHVILRESDQTFSRIPTHPTKCCWRELTQCEHILSESRSLQVDWRG